MKRITQKRLMEFIYYKHRIEWELIKIGKFKLKIPVIRKTTDVKKIVLVITAVIAVSIAWNVIKNKLDSKNG